MSHKPLTTTGSTRIQSRATAMACRPRFPSARQCVTNNSFYNGASSASSTNVYDRRGQLSEIRESTSYTGPHRASLRVTTLGCYPSRRFPLNSCKSLLFHGGNTGSIHVRDAKLEFLHDSFSTTFRFHGFILASITLHSIFNLRGNSIDAVVTNPAVDPATIISD